MVINFLMLYIKFSFVFIYKTYLYVEELIYTLIMNYCLTVKRNNQTGSEEILTLTLNCYVMFHKRYLYVFKIHVILFQM